MHISQVLIIVFITLAISGFFYLVSYLERKKLTKKNKVNPEEKFSTASAKSAVYTAPTITDHDHQLYDKFMNLYSTNGIINVSFRPGSSMTCPFGIAEGFKYINISTGKEWTDKDDPKLKKMEWGYVRIHTGVDKSNAKDYTMSDGKIIKDVVLVPFDFNRTKYIYYGNTLYGTMTHLINDEFQFEMNVAHMDPKKDFLPWSLTQIKVGNPLKKGTVLGSAGTLGDSSGNHTHTETVSLDESSEVLEILIKEKFGDKALAEYTDAEIVKEYQKYEHFKNATKTDILTDWQAWKTLRKIIFINKYFYRYISLEDGKLHTRYNSYLIFDGV